MKNFKERLKEHQISLINESTIFDGAKGGGRFRNVEQPHILEDNRRENNLYKFIQEDVRKYFSINRICLWGDTQFNNDSLPKPTGNVLSSQVFCLNHLFAIRKKEALVRIVMQKLINDKFKIDHMEKVCFLNKTKDKEKNDDEHDDKDPQYISFEAVSATQHLYEKSLTRGCTCTSIDALAIAVNTNGEKILLVMEWKLTENDTGNKAPTEETSKDKKEIASGKTRVATYSSQDKERKNLIEKCEYIRTSQSKDGYFNSFLYNLPFYELMRQTLWASLSLNDFGASDYLHIEVSHKDNIMREKKYILEKEEIGIEKAWKSLSDYPFMHLLYSQLLVCQRVCLQNTVCLICK